MKWYKDKLKKLPKFEDFLAEEHALGYVGPGGKALEAYDEWLQHLEPRFWVAWDGNF